MGSLIVEGLGEGVGQERPDAPLGPGRHPAGVDLERHRVLQAAAGAYESASFEVYVFFLNGTGRSLQDPVTFEVDARGMTPVPVARLDVPALHPRVTPRRSRTPCTPGVHEVLDHQGSGSGAAGELLAQCREGLVGGQGALVLVGGRRVVATTGGVGRRRGLGCSVGRGGRTTSCTTSC